MSLGDLNKRLSGLQVYVPKRYRKAVTRLFKSYWNTGAALAIVAALFGLWRLNSPLRMDFNRHMASINKTAAPVDAGRGPLTSYFNKLKGKSIDERVAFWSQYLSIPPTGSTAKLVPFGTGPAIADVAPLIPKQFDCTTFVEIVASLARSETPDRFFDNLMSIRYHGGSTDFASRNHFPELDWIPNNESAHILRDVTRDIARSGGADAKVIAKKFEKAKWLAAQLQSGVVTRSIASVAEPAFPAAVEGKVNYIATADLPRVMDKIPNGAIVNIVRAGSEKHPVLITHQGFAVRRGDQVYFRHSSAGGQIRTVPLLDYLKKMEAQSGSWKPIGVNLNQLSG